VAATIEVGEVQWQGDINCIGVTGIEYLAVAAPMMWFSLKDGTTGTASSRLRLLLLTTNKPCDRTTEGDMSRTT